ncbi:hypothetical protein [Algibacter luteus]|uniref:hypothetical protein n=1 Tax=Algibacter luteus TaxID=1178825 RepID=UPI0025976A56|nr:hypothetical protein [Algibacter luteus]WJJ95367.1 hypothetical protein O5O44_09050 [Algibacter luteus]
MNIKITFCLVFCFPYLIFSQTNAVTEYGDQVVLYDDGTWQQVGEQVEEKVEIPINATIFEKDEDSDFLIKSSTFNVGIWLNTKDWKFKKASSNEDAEFELELKKEDLYGSVITEKVEIPLVTLRDIALSNAREVAPDTKLNNQEYRTVNGLKVLMLEMSGTMSGIKFGYKGYYYSNENGTVQIILYTSVNLMKSYDNHIEKLLNGFVQLN